MEILKLREGGANQYRCIGKERIVKEWKSLQIGVVICPNFVNNNFILWKTVMEMHPLSKILPKPSIITICCNSDVINNFKGKRAVDSIGIHNLNWECSSKTEACWRLVNFMRALWFIRMIYAGMKCSRQLLSLFLACCRGQEDRDESSRFTIYIHLIYFAGKKKMKL